MIVDDVCLMRLNRLVAEEAGACFQVELPQVVGAAEGVAAEVAVDQRVAGVRTGVVERMDLAARAEEGDRPSLQRDEGAVGAAEDVERDAVRQAS